MVKSYREAVTYAASLAPPLEKATWFISWAEDISELIASIYMVLTMTRSQKTYTKLLK